MPQTTANLIFGTLLADVACSWVECSTSFFSERSVSCMPFLLWTVEKGKSKVYVSGRAMATPDKVAHTAHARVDGLKPVSSKSHTRAGKAYTSETSEKIKNR